ncbi:hypothetical protein TVAG_124000 [Trichomonas vaginalis G3]|uniref:Transmembrane protein 230 n=1 Tax=Trichomonas vaginalis (strain ATCC PRA-98 / G3) TaxID=412133 RepID=A2EMZ1_TRIV3|nr:eukaryotic protein of unknown function, DUF872 family [Trichomonas vaginalis G3]EAY05976.1 hypothetical protein TVAG_124000 [Trichomonas vaginalis G3]KAI5512014.1 eukaryotic protein of unknown function, DUF872 family [Trichomonas vaginalis G3]|eukprot:XP_001318199.1 hypothetical protein [Trichomonas vaginalis G3]
MKEGKVQPQKSLPIRIYELWPNFKAWCAAGDPPPQTQVKSLYLMVFLLVFGITTGTIWILSTFFNYFQGSIEHTWIFLFASFITLLPGVYALDISYHCWRRHRGYDWWIIPHFE